MMSYTYTSRRSRGSSTTVDIIFGALVILAILSYSVWYSRQVDRMVAQTCVSLGHTSCSPWAR